MPWKEATAMSLRWEIVQRASEEDANMNAVVILSAYAEMVPFSIENKLAEMDYIFSEYTKFE